MSFAPRGNGRGYRGGRGGYDDMSSGASTGFSTPNPYGGGRGGHSFNKSYSDVGPSSSASYQQKPRDNNTVYVGNLNIGTDKNSLEQAFQNINLDVRKVNILLNDQGKSKGAGFVTFGSSDEAQKVVDQCQRQGLTVEGNRLIVQLARQ